MGTSSNKIAPFHMHMRNWHTTYNVLNQQFQGSFPASFVSKPMSHWRPGYPPSWCLRVGLLFEILEPFTIKRARFTSGRSRFRPEVSWPPGTLFQTRLSPWTRRNSSRGKNLGGAHHIPLRNQPRLASLTPSAYTGFELPKMSDFLPQGDNF